VNSSALQSRKWQLISVAPQRINPLPVKMDGKIYGTRNSSLDEIGERYRLIHAIVLKL